MGLRRVLENKIRDKLSGHYRNKELSEYCFLPMSETENSFSSNLLTDIFPQKNHSPRPLQVKWMFPQIEAWYLLRLWLNR